MTHDRPPAQKGSEGVRVAGGERCEAEGSGHDAAEPPGSLQGPSPSEADAQAGAEADAQAGAERLERMAEELTCRICCDLFTEPYSLPCQHSFCRECIHECFKVTARMQCPLCKAPAWLRQLAPNHTLAGIVEVFTQMQDAGRA